MKHKKEKAKRLSVKPSIEPTPFQYVKLVFSVNNTIHADTENCSAGKDQLKIPCLAEGIHKCIPCHHSELTVIYCDCLIKIFCLTHTPSNK